MPPLRIFISYGRDQYAPLAARLAADLAACGCEVWYDQQLHTGQAWARLIQKQLNWAAEAPADGRLIYLLTRHSTREDSFCLQELQHALDHRVPVYPLLVEDCDIPIEIYGKQRLDFRPAWPLEKGESAYASLLRRLLNDLEGEPLAPLPPPEPPAGATRVRQKDGMLMCYVPAGEFLMGSTNADKDAESYEKPQHKVLLDGYWIDHTPITNAMYARFLNERGNQSEENAAWYKPASGRIEPDGNGWRVHLGFEQHPVVSVTWYGARAYAAWVEAELPSEAQWEKAARGVDGRRYPWGDQQPDKMLANDGGDWSSIPAVGSYPAGASPCGALDMSGSVWQWTRSLWGTDKARPGYAYPYDPRDASREHLDAPRKVSRILRGGSWNRNHRVSRCAVRDYYAPKSAHRLIGFRLSLRAAPWS